MLAAATLAKLGSPMYIGLLAFIAFVIGMFAFDAFRRENFSEWNIPMTVADFSNSPKKLQPVKNVPLVTDHDYYYNRYGG